MIVPCRDHAAFVGDAIESVLAQTFDDLECIVVDDASHDDTPRVLDGYADRVDVVRSERRLGISGARNLAIARARGELLAFLDADDVWLPGKLASQVARFDRDPELGALTARLQVVDASGAARPAHMPPDARFDGPDEQPVGFEDVLAGRVGLPSSAVARRDVVARARGFDPDVAGCEDFDLWLRLVRVAPLRLSREVVGRYRMHGGNASGYGRESLEARLSGSAHWRQLARTPAERRAVDRARAAGFYQLGVFEYRSGDPRGAAAGLIRRAVALDPWVDARMAGRRRHPLARGIQLARPWIGVLACAVRGRPVRSAHDPPL